MEGIQNAAWRGCSLLASLTANTLAGDQVKKFGAEAADKIQHINTQNAQAGAESEISKLKKEVCAYLMLRVLSCTGMYVAAKRPNFTEPQSMPIERWSPRDSQE